MERLSVPYQEDTVEYHIYIPGVVGDAQLSQHAANALKFLHDKFIGDYIWQDEPFQLRLFSSLNHRFRPVEPQQRQNCGASDGKEADLPNHLVGQTRFGDNIDDEWFIVYLLFELSRQFPNIFITVADNDGQFMLIESALELPAWLDADTSENRVWIHRGELCIIPPSQQFIERAEALGSLPALPAVSIPQALEILSRDFKSCLAPPTVSQCIQKRIATFPKAAHEANTHWTLCTLPLKAALVLRSHPEAIASAVRGFYHRDPISLKDAVKMKRLGPAEPSVKMMVRFSRCLYAQLLRQEFHPPLIFGNQTKPAEKSPHRREYESWLLGSKLAVGMEISYNDTRQKRLRRMATSILDTAPGDSQNLFSFDADEDWKAYKAKLDEIGFFQSQKGESPLYRSLMRKAKLKFLTSAESKMNSCFPEGSSELEHFLKDENTDLTYFDIVVDRSLALGAEKTAAQLQAECKLFDDSSSAWLDISPNEVDAIIRAREGKDSVTVEELKNAAAPKNTPSKASADADDDSDDGAEDGKVFDSMIRDMRSFMKGISGVEGVGDDAELDDATASLGPMDPEKFAELMRKSLGEEGINVEGPSDDEDDDFYAMDSDDDAEASDDEELSKESMRKLMKQMERELDSHGLRDEFERLNVGSTASASASSTSKGTKSSSKQSGASDSTRDDEDAPIDVNLNLVKNFLESYGAQHGLSGPVSNILGDMKNLTSEKKK